MNKQNWYKPFYGNYRKVNQEPPLLYDLTTLQKEANSKHGFSADKTLSIAQKLYEAKLTTYPRTGSRYISADVFDEIPQLIDKLKQHPRFGDYAKTMDNAVLNIRCVDDKKVTDHHALLITENSPKELSGDDKTIYEMVAGRMLEAFSKKCVKDTTTIMLTCGDAVFETKGSVIKQAGWRNVFNETEENTNDEAGNLPNIQEGEQLPVIHSEVMEKQTKPKPLHTEASLLSAMESAGKEVGNEEERAAMKESMSQLLSEKVISVVSPSPDNETALTDGLMLNTSSSSLQPVKQIVKMDISNILNNVFICIFL